MPISVVCPQGHKLKAKEKLAGKRLKCPKCGSVVQIPELEPLEPDDELVSHESTEPSDPQMDRPADDETSNASKDDPFGLGDASALSDPLFDADLPPLDDPSNAQAELPATANVVKTKEDAPSKRNMTLILAIVGGARCSACYWSVCWFGCCLVEANRSRLPSPTTTHLQQMSRKLRLPPRQQNRAGSRSQWSRNPNRPSPRRHLRRECLNHLTSHGSISTNASTASSYRVSRGPRRTTKQRDGWRSPTMKKASSSTIWMICWTATQRQWPRCPRTVCPRRFA